MREQADRWVNDRAAGIMDGERLASFVALDLGAKLIGIATLAHAAGETAVRDAALELLRAVAA